MERIRKRVYIWDKHWKYIDIAFDNHCNLSFYTNITRFEFYYIIWNYSLAIFYVWWTIFYCKLWHHMACRWIVVSGFTCEYELELYHANDVKELYTYCNNFMAIHVECPFNLREWDFKGKEVTETRYLRWVLQNKVHYWL